MSERLAHGIEAVARGVIYGLALSALALLSRPRPDGGDGGRGDGDDDAPVAPAPPDDSAGVVVPDYVPDVWPAPVP